MTALTSPDICINMHVASTSEYGYRHDNLEESIAVIEQIKHGQVAQNGGVLCPCSFDQEHGGVTSIRKTVCTP